MLQDYDSDEYYASLVDSHLSNNNMSEISMNNSTKPPEKGQGKFIDLLFTSKSGVGWVGGVAMPTGWACFAILVFMAFFSMPFIRKKGHFQVKNKFI